MKQIPSGSDHGPAQSVQHGPGSFIASKSEHTLQTKGADTLFLVGDVLHGGKPDPQFGTRFVQNGARRNGSLEFAVPAHEPATGRTDGITKFFAFGALEAVWPTQLLQKLPAGIFRVKPVEKLPPVLGVVHTSPRHV